MSKYIQSTVWFLASLSLIAATACLTSCSNNTNSNAQANETNQVLRIGFGPWPGFDIIAYAEQSGLFEKHGVNVELIRLDNQLDATRALYRGRLDAAFSTVSDVMINPTTQDPVSVILVSNVSYGSDGIVAQPGIENVKQLPGKKISAMQKTVNEVILYEALDAFGVDINQVDIQDISNSTAYERFINGELDAAVLWEPTLSEAAESTGGKVIFRTDQVDSLVLDVLLTRQPVIDTKREQLERFAMAWFDLMNAVDQKPQEVFDVVGKELGQTPESFASDYSGLKKGDAAFNYKMFIEGQMEKSEAKLAQLFENAGMPREQIQLIPVDASIIKQAYKRWNIK